MYLPRIVSLCCFFGMCLAGLRRHTQIGRGTLSSMSSDAAMAIEAAIILFTVP